MTKACDSINSMMAVRRVLPSLNELSAVCCASGAPRSYADAAARSQPAGADTGSGELDSTPMIHQCNKHAFPAFQKALLASRLSDSQQTLHAQELPPAVHAQKERKPVHGEQLLCPDLPGTLPELGTAAQVLKAMEFVS